MTDKTKRQDDDALAEMRTRYRRASDYWNPLFSEAKEDIKFVTVPGNQWDAALKARRKNRPMYEFPKLRMHIQQVLNEQRQSRPRGKVRGMEEADQGLAEIMQGICYNIEDASNAAQAYDIAFEKAVKGGYGVWRVCTDYLNDDDFDQDIRIEPIRNPFAAKCDPAATMVDRRDALFWFVEETIPEEEFERRYPDADRAYTLDDQEVMADWRETGKVKVCEYWHKVPRKRELWALSSGAVTYADESPLTEDELAGVGVQIVKRRMVDSYKVTMRMTNGSQWLTEPYEFPCKFIPIIPCWGNIEDVDGTDYWTGMVRFAKDSQRLHNVHRTAMVEAVAKSPKAPFIVKPKWIKGYETHWRNANSEDYPYLPVDDNADQIPQRAGQAEIPAALIQLGAIDNDDIKAATGIYDASLGARSNETTGVAINARKLQGATATFNYIDNLAYAIRFTYEILIDLIPKVYDTPRVVRILGEDGGEKWKHLYQTVQADDGRQMVINDISKGKYDVTVTVGPSYATQRVEAVEAFTQLGAQIGASFPPMAPLIAYQVIKNLDVPGSDEVMGAVRKMLVGQGLLPPKDGEEPPPPPQPNPQVMAAAQKTMADAARSAADAEKTKAETAKIQADTQMVPAELQKIIAETVQITLQNVMDGASMMPPPMPQPMPPMNQPPPGGFFSPEFTG